MNDTTKQTFKKKERLCSKKIINNLFTHGNSFHIYPFKIFWLNTKINLNTPAQVLISIPKHNIHKSVQRNLIKRRTKEAYKKNKKLFYDFLINNNNQCIFAIIFQSKDIILYKEIESKIILILKRLQEEYEISMTKDD